MWEEVALCCAGLSLEGSQGPDVRRQRPTPQPGPSSRVSYMMHKNMKLVLCQKNNPEDTRK